MKTSLKNVMFLPWFQKLAQLIATTKVISHQWNNAAPAEADVIVTRRTFITVAASTSLTTSATFRPVPLRKERCRTTTLRTVSTHSFSVISMTCNQTKTLA